MHFLHHFLFGLHFKHVVYESQSISEEEQQRILSEQKMGSFKKGGGGSSPASKKKNSKAKVSSPVSHFWSFKRLVSKWALVTKTLFPIFPFPHCYPNSPIQRSPSLLSLRCLFSLRRSAQNFNRKGLICLTWSSPDYWPACGMSFLTRRR